MTIDEAKSSVGAPNSGSAPTTLYKTVSPATGETLKEQTCHLAVSSAAGSAANSARTVWTSS